jgi:hypothetical protein
MRIPLLGGAYEGISTNTSSQEAINFFYEPPAPGEGHLGAMIPVHGATLFDTLANAGDIRGMIYEPQGQLLYVVSDNDLYSVTSGAVETARDVLATTSGRVSMALNPLAREIVTVDGNTGYHYEIGTTTATDISDADFPDTATSVDYCNGRFLVNDPTTNGKFWWSDINDGTAWDAASFSTAQSLTSPVFRILVDKTDSIYLFGRENSEVWYNSSDPDLVFERVESIECGIEGAFTACLFDNTVAWLSRTKRGGLQAVKAGGGYQPVVFSTPEITRKWEGYSTVDDAFAYSMQIDGHEFYVITFPTANATWAYDAVTQLWHRRSAAFSGGSPTREKANCHAYCGGWSGGTHILGDFNETGKLFAVSTSVYTFDSANMERRATGPALAAMNESRLRFSEVQVDIEEGIADAGDSGNDDELTLYWSKDGGHTYTTGVQLNLGVGASTGYATRLMQRKLGYGRNWIFRIYSDTPRKLIVKGAYGRVYGEGLDGSSPKEAA